MTRHAMSIIILCAVTSAVVLGGCSQSTPDAGSTTISGMLVGGNASGIRITAEPVNGGNVLTAAADERDNFSIRVEPGVTYRLSGTYNPSSEYAVPSVIFYYQNGSHVDEITLKPGQKALINYRLAIGMMTPVITPPAK